MHHFCSGHDCLCLPACLPGQSKTEARSGSQGWRRIFSRLLCQIGFQAGHIPGTCIKDTTAAAATWQRQNRRQQQQENRETEAAAAENAAESSRFQEMCTPLLRLTGGSMAAWQQQRGRPQQHRGRQLVNLQQEKSKKERKKKKEKNAPL